MLNTQKTPKQGLEILEKLREKHPKHQGIKNNLINAYIRFNHYSKAVDEISSIASNKSDVHTLRSRAWIEHKKGNIDNEKKLWKEILDKTTYLEISAKINNFIKYDTRKINIDKKDILLICVVYNEMLRLSFFLNYYRNLGITKFFFIDNNSNDGSLEFLLNQPDCHVFWTDDSYPLSASGIYWVHHLLDNYIPENQWCIHADADEFLVYPHCENHKLPTLTQYLDKHGYEAIASFMLDMYPKDINSQLSITQDDDLLKISPYFYNNYQFFYQDTSPYIRPVGGIFQHYGIYDRRVKTALFKANKELRFLSATHASTPTKIANISSVYFHFKMIGDFYQKSIIEQNRKEHAGGGRAYTQYARIYESFNGENFDFTSLDKTVKYKNSQQLIQLGLIKTSNEWNNFILDKNTKTPSEGLAILEQLNQKYPNNDNIKNNLINIYIRLNHVDKAKKLIEQKPINYHNIQNIKFYAWLAHQNKETAKELEYWLNIFHKQLIFLPKNERDYLLSQAITNEKKLALCKENLIMLFNQSHSSLPIKLQKLLGAEIKNVILIANNHETTFEHLKHYITDNDLIICFNFSIFLKFYENFSHNYKLFFFRKENILNHHFLGLPQSTLLHRSMYDIDFESLYDVIRQDNSFLLFNEHLPHTLNLPDDIYHKIYNPQFTGIISQFHRIFYYLQPMEFYFNTSSTTPTSGFMVLKYLYYTRLHLLNLGKPSFNIKLLGFNFTNNSFYQTHGVHNWEYERSQQENLPDSIQRIIVP